jgi:hypothetical protein
MAVRTMPKLLAWSYQKLILRCRAKPKRDQEKPNTRPGFFVI